MVIRSSRLAGVAIALAAVAIVVGDIVRESFVPEDLLLVLACALAARGLWWRDERDTAIAARTRELEQNLGRYRALVENTQAIPFEYNPTSDRMLYVAPQLHALLGGTTRRIHREFLRSMIHPEDRTRVRQAVAAYARGSTADAIDYRLVRDDGKIVHVRTLLSDRSADGSFVRGVTLDATKQQQLEAELRQAQKLQSVGRLAAGVAHEINTPIQFVADSVQFVRESVGELLGGVARQRELAGAVIAGTATPALAEAALAAADAADLEYLGAQLPTALDRANDGLARVATIVRSMKAFAQPDRSEHTLVDLNEAIKTTLTIARSEYKYVADIELALGAIPPVSCHAGELNQVILNVLMNAAHAITEVVRGTDRRGLITIRTRTEGDHVAIAIDDTGGGIPEGIRDCIFDPFFTTKGVGHGTGQGLAIARSVVVDKHHGSLTFDTRMGIGTTFQIQIPIVAEGAAA